MSLESLIDPPPETFNLAEYCLDARLSEGFGDQPALYVGDRCYSYRQVSERTNQMANLFKSQGLQVEQRLLLSLSDGLDYVAALFGALKLGAAVVMLNPGFTPEENQAMVDYARARLVIVEPERQESFGGRLPLVTPEQANRHPLDFRPEYRTHRDDVAIWLFSGGTTGRPKAVLQSHRSFYNTTELYAKRFLGYQRQDRTLSVPKLFFGYATGSNLIFPFSVGASAVLFPEKCSADVLFQQIARHRPTILVNVPTMVNHMVGHSEAPSQDLSCLRLATSAGEALPEALFHRWHETFGVDLLDGLGTAEMWHIFLSNPPGAARAGTLGRPVPGFTVKAADDEGREVPVGEVGRLWVRGDSRALCYWQESEKSQEALRGPWFVSSDLVSQDEDGYYRYCGRGDELLKVAGRWLAPQEVESCLLTHPAVKECAVVGIVCEDGLIRPHAYVVAEGPTGPELEQSLKDHVLAALEPYKHPRRVLFVASLPRTHLGKVDRGALRSGSLEVCGT